MAPDPDARPALADPYDDADERAALEAWRAAYVDRLSAPAGWWAVSNLAWLDGETALLGTGPEADLPLRAAGPPRVARLERFGDALRVMPSGEVPLRLDGRELTAPVEVGTAGGRLRLEQEPAVEVAIFRRGGRWGVRVYDPSRATTRDAGHVGWFDVRPGWRVAARAEPGGGETLPIVDVLGGVREEPVAARLRFRLGGADRTLVATAQGEDLFVAFRDATNGSRTYGAGRYLVVERPRNGAAILDFHRAHHPPCAHTPHAMCPLPPLSNRLDVPVLAGERSVR